MSKFLPKRILVTGGAGFIGSNYVRFALKEDPNVFIINLDLLTYAGSKKNLENLCDNQRHHFVHGDICDEALVSQLLRHFEINSIVHFAAESHVDRSISKPDAFIQTNIVGTFTLLEAARRYWQTEKKYDSSSSRFHHISTDEVYGTLKSIDEAKFNEKTPYSPNSPYAASKASSDHLVRAYYSTFGLPVVITNCSNNFGPRQHAEKFIPTIIQACLKDQPIPVYGNGSNIRDWLYVEDHCRSLFTVLKNGTTGESYNIGGDNEIDNLTLVKKICKIMDNYFPKSNSHETLIRFVQDRLGHDWRYAIDNTKLKVNNLWHPPTNFDEGLKATIEFYCHSELLQFTKVTV